MMLHTYFAKRFFKVILATSIAFALLIVLLDLVEQLRITGGDNLAFTDVVLLVLSNLPSQFYEFLPLVIVIGSISVFINLSRSSELVIARAVGRSAIRALLGPIVSAFLIGVVAICALNPLVATTTAKYDKLLAEFTEVPVNVFSLSNKGFWLRQGGDNEQVVISAERSNSDGSLLYQTTLFGFGSEGRMAWRIEAARAELGDGMWVLRNAERWPLGDALNPEAEKESFDEIRIPTDLTRDHIEDSFGAPVAISIWNLPEFINRLQESGFSARRHIVWWHQQLALPAFLAMLVVLTAAFTVRHSRLQNTSGMILIAMMFSFGIYFVRNFAQILSDNGQMTPILAAWLPIFVGFGIGLGVLFHTEDG